LESTLWLRRGRSMAWSPWVHRSSCSDAAGMPRCSPGENSLLPRPYTATVSDHMHLTSSPHLPTRQQTSLFCPTTVDLLPGLALVTHSGYLNTMCEKPSTA
jgi:hypothetical protein